VQPWDLSFSSVSDYYLVPTLAIQHGHGDIEVLRLVLAVFTGGASCTSGGGRRSARQPRQQRGGLAALVTVVIAHAARGRRVIVGAGLARIEIRQRLAEIVLDHLQLHDLLADLRLLLGEQRADPRRGLAPGISALEIAHEALDLGERE